MKLNKHIYILIALVSVLYTNRANAQITVGSDKAPESFSIVEVVGETGGVHMPRMNETDRDNLGLTLVGKPESIGLMIFNEKSKMLEFWDGDKWCAVMSHLEGENGVTVTPINANTNEIKLGGTPLIKNTTIDQKDKALNFKLSSTGQFLINSSVTLNGNTATNSKSVNINPSGAFTINNTVANFAGSNVTMQPSKFTINTNATKSPLTVNESSTYPGVKFEGLLQYTDGTEKSGYLLASDANGNAYWDALRPLGTVVLGKLDDNGADFQDYTGKSQDKNITTKSLILPKGRWLIFGKFTGVMNSHPAGMYHWISLLKKAPTASSYLNSDMVIQIGTNPESKTEQSGIYSYSTPSFICQVDISERTEFAVFAGTANKRSDKTTDKFGGSYFYAVRLDIPVIP